MERRNTGDTRSFLCAMATALLGLAATVPGPLQAQATGGAEPGQGGQCNVKPNFGCERGAWSLNGNKEATIASLSTAATYRVCVWDPPLGNNDIGLNVVLDDELLTVGPSKRPMVLMPVLDAVAQPNEAASCVLLTARKIKLVATPQSSAARYPRGYYERLGPIPFVGQQRIETQPIANGSVLYPIASARLAGGAGKRLYRVCLGRFFGPADERPSTVRTDLRVDGVVIPMVNSSCADVEGAELSGETWGPAGGPREPAMSGLLVY